MLAGLGAFFVCLIPILIVVDKICETWVLFTNQDSWYSEYGGFE